MPTTSPTINHLAFADDMIIVCKVEAVMRLVTETLDKYKSISGQKINKEKSTIYMHYSALGGDVILIEVVTRILRKEFPFTYLGCPIFYRRKQKSFYNQMVHRIFQNCRHGKESYYRMEEGQY